MSSKNLEANDYGHSLDLLIITHNSHVSYRTGSVELTVCVQVMFTLLKDKVWVLFGYFVLGKHVIRFFGLNRLMLEF